MVAPRDNVFISSTSDGDNTELCKFDVPLTIGATENIQKKDSLHCAPYHDMENILSVNQLSTTRIPIPSAGSWFLFF